MTRPSDVRRRAAIDLPDEVGRASRSAWPWRAAACRPRGRRSSSAATPIMPPNTNASAEHARQRWATRGRTWCRARGGVAHARTAPRIWISGTNRPTSRSAQVGPGLPELDAAARQPGSRTVASLTARVHSSRPVGRRPAPCRCPPGSPAGPRGPRTASPYWANSSRDERRRFGRRVHVALRRRRVQRTSACADDPQAPARRLSRRR